MALLETRPVRNQQDLVQLLAAAGIETNQATLSRDLRDLGVMKGPDGYTLPAASVLQMPDTASNSQRPDRASAMLALRQAVQQWLLSVQQAQNLIVLRTPAGGASPLALAIDSWSYDPDYAGTIGTIAGDDTVLVICKDGRAAQRLQRHLELCRTGGRVTPKRRKRS